MPQAAKISVGLHVFLVDREAGKVLLLKRANTGRYDGRWSVPAGRLDVGESFSQWAKRELFEETGVTAEVWSDPFVMCHRDENGTRAYFFFLCDSWIGEPKNVEPEKCEALEWHDFDELPDSTLPHVALALRNMLRSDERYAEWEVDSEGFELRAPTEGRVL